MAINTIQEGMSWSQVFTIINALITAFNAYDTAVGGALVGGNFDYTALVNKPKLADVELSGSVELAEIGVTDNEEVLDEVSALNTRVAAVETSNSGYGTRISTLEGNRTSDAARITTLENNQSNNSNVANRLTALEASVTNLSNAATADRATLNSQVTAMAAQVTVATNAKNAAVAAQEALEDLPSNESIQDIVSKLNTVITRVNTLSNIACGQEIMLTCQSSIQQLVLES